jgi:hypothetical protein
VPALLGVSALLAACGKTEIDAGQAEKFVRGAFAQPPKSVKCPSGVEAKKGSTFECRVVDNIGRPYVVTLHIDKHARVTVGRRDVRPAR